MESFRVDKFFRVVDKINHFETIEKSKEKYENGISLKIGKSFSQKRHRNLRFLKRRKKSRNMFESAIYFKKYRTVVSIQHEYMVCHYNVDTGECKNVTIFNCEDPEEDGYESEEMEIRQLLKLNGEEYLFRDGVGQVGKCRADLMPKKNGHQVILNNIWFGLCPFFVLNDEMAIGFNRGELVVYPYHEPGKMFKKTFNDNRITSTIPYEDSVRMIRSTIDENKLYFLFRTGRRKKIRKGSNPPETPPVKNVRRVDFSNLEDITFEKEYEQPSGVIFERLEVMRIFDDDEVLVCVDRKCNFHLFDAEEEQLIKFIETSNIFEKPTALLKVPHSDILMMTTSNTDLLCFDMKRNFSLVFSDLEIFSSHSRTFGITEMESSSPKTFAFVANLDDMLVFGELKNLRAGIMELKDQDERAGFFQEFSLDSACGCQVLKVTFSNESLQICTFKTLFC